MATNNNKGLNKIEKSMIDPDFVAEVDQVSQQLADMSYTVKTQSGVIDYSEIINTATQNYDNILIKNGTYDVDATKLLRLKSNTRIVFEPNAVFKVIPNAEDVYEIFDMRNVQNISIHEATLVGDKYTHLGTTGQHGHGIRIIDSQNIKIFNTRCEKFWGDGLYIRGGKDVEVSDIVCDDNRRQGISITRGENIKLIRPVCTNTSGQNPGAGIDIEPNTTADYLRNIKIYNPILHNNGQAYDYGIVVSLHRFISQQDPPETSDVSIDVYDADVIGSIVVGGRNASKGYINFHRPIIKNAHKSGIYIVDSDSKNLEINIYEPQIHNVNRAEASTIYNNGIFLEASNPVPQDYGGMKNVKIYNPKIRHKGVSVAAIRLNDDLSDAFENCAIINPDIAGDFHTNFTASRGGVAYSPLDETFELSYGNKYMATSISHGSSITNDYGRTNVEYTSSLSSDGTIYVSDSLRVTDVEIKITNKSPNGKGLNVVFGTSTTPSPKIVYPVSQIPVTKLYLGTKFSSVKMKKISETEFVIVESKGVTTVE